MYPRVSGLTFLFPFNKFKLSFKFKTNRFLSAAYIKFCCILRRHESIVTPLNCRKHQQWARERQSSHMHSFCELVCLCVWLTSLFLQSCLYTVYLYHCTVREMIHVATGSAPGANMRRWSRLFRQGNISMQFQCCGCEAEQLRENVGGGNDGLV